MFNIHAEKSLYQRSLSFFLSCIMIITSCLNPEIAALVASAAEEVPINDVNSYDVQLYWRDDENTGENEETSKSVLIREDDADKKRFVYLEIYVNNKTTLSIQPGEFELTFDGLDGLCRSIAESGNGTIYGFKESDSVFAKNWKIKSHTTEMVNGKPKDTYTIVNLTPLSNERISTLFWELSTRDSKATENGKSVNVETGEISEKFYREINASYRIVRLNRDEHTGELLDERFADILSGSEKLTEEHIRIVNHSYIQALFEKDGNTYDIAAYDNNKPEGIDNYGLPTWVNNLGNTELGTAVGTENGKMQTGTGYTLPYRAYSNVYLRSAVTKLVSRTNVIEDLELSTTGDDGNNKWYGTGTTKDGKPYQPFGDLAERYKSDETYFGVLETYATLQSENPVTLKEFTVAAELPEFVQLPTDDNGKVDLEQIFDSIKFSSQYFTGNKNNARAVDESILKLGENVTIAVEETRESVDEHGNRIPPSTKIILKFNFSVGSALLADALTEISFQYPVVVFAENDELKQKKSLTAQS